MNYDEDYEIEESDMAWITEAELPSLIRAFEETATQYSRENNLPAIMGYFNIMGSLLQDYIEIPKGATSIDTRCHFCWIQTARTGKTTLVEYVLKPLATKLAEELEGALKEDFKIISLDDYTTASLVGSHKDNIKYDPAAEQEWVECQAKLLRQLNEERVIEQAQYDIQYARGEAKYEKTKDEFHIFPSQLEGSGIWYADEFEGSGIFTPKSHNDNINIVFQTFMNNFHIGANKYDKVLTGKPTVTLDSKFSVFAGTFIPQKLDDTIMQKGIMQRFLPFIYEVPRDRLTAQRLNLARSFGTRTENRGPPFHLVEPMKNVVLKTKARFEEMNDRESTIIYSEHASELVEEMYSNIQKYVENLPPHISEVVSTFEANLLEYINKLAIISCATNNANSKNPTWRLTKTHVLQGGSVVWMCYKTLVSYLEENLHIKAKPKMKPNSQLAGFIKAYQLSLNVDILKEGLIKWPSKDSMKISEWEEQVNILILDGFAYKKTVQENAEKVLSKSKASIANYWKNIEDKFLYKKVDKLAFIKPKEEIKNGNNMGK